MAGGGGVKGTAGERRLVGHLHRVSPRQAKGVALKGREGDGPLWSEVEL